MRHFLTTEDWSRDELQQMLDDAAALKSGRVSSALAGKTIALMFFNPSLRTRSSFEIGARQLGGHAIVLAPGRDAWPLEFESGAIMDGEAEEHVREAARVLSRYCDLIAIRAFPKFQDWSIDREDRLIRAFAEVTLLCPNTDYVLDPRYMQAAEANATAAGGSVSLSHDIESAYTGADFVYAKSWGALPFFGRWDQEQPIRDRHRHFIVDERKMDLTNNARFSHCLPCRRNVKVTDGVMDADYCIAIDEAENRLHVQKALMATLVGQAPSN
ncbi:MAG: hypothetical protein P8X53_06395 [Chromatiales bacterium]